MVRFFNNELDLVTLLFNKLRSVHCSLDNVGFEIGIFKYI